MEISQKEKLDTILKHIEMEVNLKGEEIAIKEMRKHISAYTKSLKDSSSFRSKINTLDTKSKVVECLKDYFESI